MKEQSDKRDADEQFVSDFVQRWKGQYGGSNPEVIFGRLARYILDGHSHCAPSHALENTRAAEMECQYSRCVNHDLRKDRCDHCPIDVIGGTPHERAAVAALSTTPQKPGSETPRMDAALGKGADWVFAQGCQLERELAARNEQLRQSCDEYRADHGGCCAASATRESALEEAAKLCEEAAGEKQRTEADRERNRTCLTLAKMIREAMNRADGGKQTNG